MGGRRGLGWLGPLGRWLGRERRTDPAGREVADEIEFHLERTVETLRREGLDAEAARREARRRFGDVELHRDNLTALTRSRLRTDRRLALLGAAASHVRLGLRGLRAAPGFTVTVILTLALGIGANATMFGIIDRVLLSPPPHIVAPDQVRRLYVTRRLLTDSFTTSSVAYPDFTAFAEVEGFAATAAYTSQRGTLGEAESARPIRESFVSGGFFELLGAQPALGRFFGPDDDRADAPEVVVLGHAVWQEAFAADPGIVGRTVRISNTPMTVIGIAPEGLTGVDLERVDAWLPLNSRLTGGASRWDTPGWYWLAVIARVRPGATTAALSAEATAVHRGSRADDSRYDPEATVSVASLIAARGPRASDESRVARWLSGVSLLVLLVACANVGNLLLARGIRKRGEIGIRLALGISRARLVGELVAESLLLAGAGGLLAFVLAGWAGNPLRAILFPSIYWVEPAANFRVFGFTFLAAVASGLLAGLLPAWQSSRSDVRAMFMGAATSNKAPSRSRAGLMLVQCSLSVLLLVGAGLFVRSLRAVYGIDLGLDADGVLMALPDMFSHEISGARAAEIFESVEQRLVALPGVRSASFTAGSAPLTYSFVTELSVPGVEEIPNLPGGGPYYALVTEDFFDTMGMTITRGRPFSAADGAGAQPVAIVNETMARALWPDDTALGKCLRVGEGDPPCAEIVGVAHDVRDAGYVEEPRMQYYLAWRQHLVPNALPLGLIVATRADAGDEVAGDVRAAFVAVAPELGWVNVRSLRSYLDPQARSWHLGATMFSTFGLLALAVASVGLYGMLAFEVAQRRREMGVRAALGAAPARLVTMVLVRAVGTAALGVGVGLLIAVALGRWIEPLLYRVSPRDPQVLLGAAAALLLVALLAAAIPARRTSRLDPVRALRME